MGLRTKTALVIAATAAIVATLTGLLVHQRTAEEQWTNAARAADTRLVEAAGSYAAGTDNGPLVNPPDLSAALRRTITDRSREQPAGHPESKLSSRSWTAMRTNPWMPAPSRRRAGSDAVPRQEHKVVAGRGHAHDHGDPAAHPDQPDPPLREGAIAPVEGAMTRMENTFLPRQEAAAETRTETAATRADRSRHRRRIH